MMSSGLGASVLTFFGEWGPVVGCGGGSEWSGAGCLGEGLLGAWRSARAVWEGCQGRSPRCNSLEALRRCMLSQDVRMVVWRVFRRRVGVWWGVPVGLGWRTGGVCPGPVLCLLQVVASLPLRSLLILVDLGVCWRSRP